MKNRVLMILATVVLTAGIGRIQYGDHIETWYDLPMTRITEIQGFTDKVLDLAM